MLILPQLKPNIQANMHSIKLKSLCLILLTNIILNSGKANLIVNLDIKKHLKTITIDNESHSMRNIDFIYYFKTLTNKFFFNIFCDIFNKQWG